MFLFFKVRKKVHRFKKSANKFQIWVWGPTFRENGSLSSKKFVFDSLLIMNIYFYLRNDANI